MGAGEMFEKVIVGLMGLAYCRLEKVGQVFRAHIGGNGSIGRLRLFDSLANNDKSDDATMILDALSGDIIVRSRKTATEILKFWGERSALYIGNKGNEGDIFVFDGEGRVAFDFSAKQAALKLGAGPLAGHQEGNEGDLIVLGKNGLERVWVTGEKSTYKKQNGHIIVRNAAGENTVVIDGDKGDIVLQGGDCAEEFSAFEGHDIEPGMVVESAGAEQVRPVSSAFSKAVVGVVSGANGLRPGIVLHRVNGRKSTVPVALAGKVYCRADASYGAIAVGDLLASSPTLGHAMRVDEPSSYIGCIVGKALDALPEGRGEVLMLVGMR